MEQRLIDANDLSMSFETLDTRCINDCSNCRNHWGNYCEFEVSMKFVQEKINEASTISQQARHAHWVSDNNIDFKCSNCRKHALHNFSGEYVLSDHCPNCGYRMDEQPLPNFDDGCDGMSQGGQNEN